MSIIGTLPNTIANGDPLDATPVMADFNWIVSQVNGNAAPLASPAFTGPVTIGGTIAVDSGSTGQQGVFGHTFKEYLTENGTTAGLLHTGAIATGTGVSFTATAAMLQVAGSAVLTGTGTGVSLPGTLAVTGLTSVGGSSPASGAAGVAGTITWDASFIYVCTASGAWKRAALTGGY